MQHHIFCSFFLKTIVLSWNILEHRRSVRRGLRGCLVHSVPSRLETDYAMDPRVQLGSEEQEDSATAASPRGNGHAPAKTWLAQPGPELENTDPSQSPSPCRIPRTPWDGVQPQCTPSSDRDPGDPQKLLQKLLTETSPEALAWLLLGPPRPTPACLLHLCRPSARAGSRGHF